MTILFDVKAKMVLLRREMNLSTELNSSASLNQQTY